MSLFWIHFVFVQEKNGRKWCLCFNISYFTYFRYSLCRNLTGSSALHGFGEIFTHAIWLISPDTLRFSSDILRKTEMSWFADFEEDWNLLVFFPYIKLWKEVQFVKNGYLKFKLWVTYEVWFCWQIPKDCTLWLT